MRLRLRVSGAACAGAPFPTRDGRLRDQPQVAGRSISHFKSDSMLNSQRVVNAETCSGRGLRLLNFYLQYIMKLHLPCSLRSAVLAGFFKKRRFAASYSGRMAALAFCYAIAGASTVFSAEDVTWSLTSGVASTSGYSTTGAITFTLKADSTSYDLESTPTGAPFADGFLLQNISITVGSTTTLWGILCETSTGVALAGVSAGSVTPGTIATFDFSGTETSVLTDTSYTLAFVRNGSATSLSDIGVTIGEQYLTGSALAAGNKLPIYVTTDTDLIFDGNLGFSDAKLNGAYGNDIPAVSMTLKAESTPEPPAENFYWESGSSDWAGDKWATTDDDTTLVSLPTGGTVNVIFNDSETATVSVGSVVSVSSMRVDGGVYTFTGNVDSRIEIEGALTVANGATADIQTGLKAGSIGVAGTLSLSGDIEVPAVTVEETGVLNLSNTTIGSAMAITNNGTLNISDSTIETTLANNNTVNLSGTINLQGITGTTGAEMISTTANGYATVTTTYAVVAGGTSSGTGVTDWQLDGRAVSGTTAFSDGVLSVTTSGTVYYVTVDEVTYDGEPLLTGLQV